MQSRLGPVILLPAGIFLTISYYRRQQSIVPTAWQGAKLGLLIGLLSSAFFTIFFAIKGAADVPAYRQQMQKLAQDAVARQPTPESQQLAQAWFNGPHTVEVVTALLVGSTFFFLMVISGVSGVLAGAIAKRRYRP